MLAILITTVETMEDAVECRNLAAKVWGETSACSVAQMSVHAKYGGVLLLAMAGKEAIGFLFSFPALYQGEWVLWSHETAVLPAYVHLGIGTQLKRTQRKRAAELGYQKIAWTFDPLVSRNAFFNLHKLGAHIVEYKVNAYGTDASDAVNQGMETDRFIATWDVQDNGQPQGWDVDLTNQLVVLNLEQEGNPSVVEEKALGTVVSTEIPLCFETLVRSSRDLAVAWRLAFRRVAKELFEQGFLPTKFVVKEKHGEYIWTRKGEEKSHENPIYSA